MRCIASVALARDYFWEKLSSQLALFFGAKIDHLLRISETCRTREIAVVVAHILDDYQVLKSWGDSAGTLRGIGLG